MAQKNQNTKVKQPNNAPNNLVVNTVEIRPIERRKQNVPDWRNAMQIAESRIPRRQMLYSLYHDTVLDDQVIADWCKRIDAVTLANWKFIDTNGEEVEEINQLIDSIGFDEILTEILNTKAWGYTMLEPKFYKNNSERWEVTANLVPRRHMFVEKGIISKDGISDTGINVRKGIYSKTIMEIGKTTDLGLLLPASLPVILKRGGVGDYAQFVQVYGSPIMDLVWDGYDLDQKQKLDTAIQQMGSGGKLVRPKGTEVKILENKTAGNNPHNGFITLLNNAISHVLLGTTETSGSSQSSGFAQSKTHQEENNKKHKSDVAYVRKTLNSRFIKILATHGFDTKGGKFIVQGDEIKLSKTDHFNIVKEAKEKFNLPMDDDWLYEKFDIKKPDNYKEQIKQRNESQPSAANHSEPNTSSAKKKMVEKEVNGKKEKTEEKEVKLAEDSLFKKLVNFFRVAPAQQTGAIKKHLTTCCGNHHTVKLNFNTDLNENELIKRAWEAKGKLNFDFKSFKNTSQLLLKGFKKGWDDDFIQLNFNPSFEYGIDDPALLTAFEQNLFRFSGTKTLAQAQLLNTLFRESNSFSEFEKKALEQINVFNRQWLETEYNTAILTGQASATYHRLIKQAHIFPYWRYETVGDEDVRPEHALLQGLILPANDPRWLKIFPPNGWNCRCRIVPIMAHEFNKTKLAEMRKRADNYIKSTQFAKEEAQGFGVNRAVLKQVFTANQQYVKKFPGKASKLINKLGFSDFELQSFSNAKKVATKDYEAYTGTGEDFYKALESLNDQKVIRDYTNRPLEVELKNYTVHINKKQNRVQLLQAMQETLKQPDESWLTGEALEELVHLKYYKNETIVVVSRIKNGILELRTWFTLKEKKNVINKFRRGLLVYNK